MVTIRKYESFSKYFHAFMSNIYSKAVKAVETKWKEKSIARLKVFDPDMLGNFSKIPETME